MIGLRPYQYEGVDRVFEAWEHANAVLGVASTGLGKTILFASIIGKLTGRAMVLAHREELIFQAAEKIERVTGEKCDIEMAEYQADEYSLHGRARVVVSTVQTQIAGKNGGRMKRFKPEDFDLLVIDEAHHAVADTYRRVIEYFRQNPRLKVLGVTATPDRTDEEALGAVFERVAFDFDIRFGIEDGWLVPIVQRTVAVEHLDLSAVRTTAGDLNGADLARVLEYEQPLLEMATPTLEIACGMTVGTIGRLIRDNAFGALADHVVRRRKTLVFAASVAHAERFAEVLNRFLPGSADWLCGTTPKLDRREMFKKFAAGKFQFLVNVGVATEGFDDPGVEVVVMARPTKSRSLYAQMIGRGTRPLPGVVDDPDHFAFPELRIEAIAASAKPNVEIVDFVGNAGRHRLITTLDILGGHYPDEVLDRARKKATELGKVDSLQAIEAADQEVQEEREQQRREAEARAAEIEREKEKRLEELRRAHLVASANYQSEFVDPFDILGVARPPEMPWDKEKQPTQKMIDMLERQGISTEGMSFNEARSLQKELFRRWEHKLCSPKQAAVLRKRGYDTNNLTREEASAIMDRLAQEENWKPRKPRSQSTARTPVTGPPPGVVY